MEPTRPIEAVHPTAAGVIMGGRWRTPDVMRTTGHATGTGVNWFRSGEAPPMVDLLASRRDEILRVARGHGVTRIRVFGSIARGEARADSDVDLLVEVGPDPSPWFPGGLVADLEELLNRRVQVVTERGLDELLRDRVLGEAVPL